MKRLLLLPLALLACVAVIRADALDDEPTRAELRAVSRGNNRFALDLYGQLRAKDGNLFVSPFSVSSALSMTSAGARGKTLEQMQDALHLADQKTLHPTLGWLVKKFNAKSKKRGYELNVANALWGQKGYTFKADFLKINKTHYGADLKTLDFVGNRASSAKDINAWVEKQTNAKIKKLVDASMFNPNTKLVLTNAIYFQGDWASQFKKTSTTDQPFHLDGDKTVKVPLMYQGGTFGYGGTRDVQVLELPYKGKEVSMVVLLPKKGGLAAMEKGLTLAQLEKYTGSLRQRKVHVFLPRFKMESAFQLREPLSALGMKLAFTSGADFSGMDGTKNLYISAVVHKAYVEVDEKGTKAAGATGVIVETKSAPSRVPTFRADRPFVFLIRDMKTGSVLFMGRVANPK